MKKNNRGRVLLVLVVLIVILQNTVYATVDLDRSDTEFIGIERVEAENVLKYLKWRTISEETFQDSDSPLKELINTGNCLIIGLEDNRIGILDLEGHYIKGFAFDTTGNYDIFYNFGYDVFTVYIWRGGNFFTFDMEGKLVAIEKSDMNHKDEIKYGSESGNQSNKVFYLNAAKKNPIFSRGYNQIMEGNVNGSAKIIYEIPLSLIDENVITRLLVIICAVIASGIVFCLLFCRKCRQKLRDIIERKAWDDRERWESIFRLFK